jgi:hypothetical protein
MGSFLGVRILMNLNRISLKLKIVVLHAEIRNLSFGLNQVHLMQLGVKNAV